MDIHEVLGKHNKPRVHTRRELGKYPRLFYFIFFPGYFRNLRNLRKLFRASWQHKTLILFVPLSKQLIRHPSKTKVLLGGVEYSIIHQRIQEECHPTVHQVCAVKSAGPS